MKLFNNVSNGMGKIYGRFSVWFIEHVCGLQFYPPKVFEDEGDAIPSLGGAFSASETANP